MSALEKLSARIRAALATGPTPGPWVQEPSGHLVWADDDEFLPIVADCDSPETAAFVAACNPAAIAALLAVLDAQALPSLPLSDAQIEAISDEVEDVCYSTRTFSNWTLIFVRAVERAHGIGVA